MRSFVPLVALAGAAALTLSGCANPGGSGSGNSGELRNGGTFSFALGTDPGDLNPMVTAMASARAVDRFLYSRLIELQKDGTILSGLASDWEADTETATFTLREGSTCADGTAITASMLADNINLIADPENGSPLIGLNVQPGTVATGDDASGVLTVKSGAPDAFLLENLGSVHMVCGNMLADPDALAKGEGATGMYTMTNIVPNSEYTLTLREEFSWGPGDWDPKQAGIPAEVVFKILPNETTTANLLLSGELSAAQIVGPDAERLRTEGLFVENTEAGIGQAIFNQNPARVLTDEATRVALVQGMNLEELRTVLTSGNGVAPTNVVNMAPNPCNTDVVAESVPAFDVKEANAGLDAAGWKLGADGIREKEGKKLSLTVIYPSYSSDTFGSTAELLQSTWKEIGVDATLKGVDANGVNEALFATGDWDVSMIALNVGLPSEIVPFYAGPTPPDGSNFAHSTNKEYLASITAAATQAGQEGCADWSAGEAALLASATVVPFANSVFPTFGHKAEFLISDSIDPTSIRLFS